jgi:prevent-host-death family protein
MNTVGVRELKTHLSRHLRRVRSGARLIVTERGRAIATIDPVEPPGCRPQVAAPSGHTVSAAVLEDRR